MFWTEKHVIVGETAVRKNLSVEHPRNENNTEKTDFHEHGMQGYVPTYKCLKQVSPCLYVRFKQ